jgi:hypothetical protein
MNEHSTRLWMVLLSSVIISVCSTTAFVVIMWLLAIDLPYEGVIGLYVGQIIAFIIIGFDMWKIEDGGT